MKSVAMSGDDTIIINDHVFTDLADGNVGELNYPNSIANLKTGKNGNSIYSYNASGKQASLKLRVVRGSQDDKFLNNLLASQQLDFSLFVLLSGEFVKKMGDGQGNLANDTYILSGGIFTKFPDAVSNVEGDSGQSVSHYEFIFSNAPRVIT